MKLLIYLSFLAVLVLVQAREKGKGKQNEMTFSDLLDTITKKTKDYRFDVSGVYDIETKISYVAKISFASTDFLDQISAHTHEFMTYKNARYLKSKVPKNFGMYETIAAPDYLYNTIEAINVARKVQIKKLHEDILAELAVASPDENDHEFFEAYRIFSKNTRTRKEAQRISDTVGPIRGSYIEFSNRITRKIRDLSEMAKDIQKELVDVSGICESMALTPDNQYVMDALNSLKLLNENHNKMIELIGEVKDVIKDYNIIRMTWAEYLVGMTEHIGGTRKAIIPSQSTVEKLGKAMQKGMHLGKS